MDDNKIVYESKQVSPDYFGKERLFKVEKEFIRSHSSQLRSSAMLDVGIGGGRTTSSFAPAVEKYFGVDYSAAMIDYCREKFKGLKNTSFYEMDARALTEFHANQFDLVLFSFNGIDCVDYEGREKILREFNRVLKPGGILLFSFHNVRHLRPLYSFQMPRNPLKIPGELQRRKMLRKINGGKEKFEGKEMFSIYDGADHFQTMLLYLLPEKQRDDLKNAGFEISQWNELESGKIISPAQLKKTTVPWIFIYARKS